MRICFVIQSIQTQAPHYSTTYLGFEAQRRGHEVHYASVSSFSLGTNGIVRSSTRRISGNVTSKDKFLERIKDPKLKPQVNDLNAFDVVFLRYNPFHPWAEWEMNRNPAMEFALRLKHSGVLVLNDPDGLQQFCSKMHLLDLPKEIAAKTFISRTASMLKEFLKSLDGPAVLKPLRGYGGENVFYISGPSDKNLNQIITTVGQNGYVVAQEYIPAAKGGDKRMLLLNGQPLRMGKQVAIYSRLSPKGDIRSNIHIGGVRRRTSFTAEDARVAELLMPRLRELGLYFVGVDLAGKKLMEINVFCPGGIHNINDLYQVRMERAILDDLESQVENRKATVIPLRKRGNKSEI